MTCRRVIGIGVLAVAVVCGVNAAPPVVAAQGKMTTFYLCLFALGPNGAMPIDVVRQATDARRTYFENLITQGALIIAGPIGGHGRLRSIVVLRVGSTDEARTIALADPEVKAGVLEVEVHPWFCMDGIMKPVFTMPSDLTYYFGLLRKGPTWTPEETEETKSIQAGHMAHLEASAKAGTLVLAGPLGDSGDIRGILIYKTATIDEANAVASADPAVKAGRLIVEMHPWILPKGALPDGAAAPGR